MVITAELNQRAGDEHTPVLGILPGSKDLQPHHSRLQFALG